MRGWDSAEDNAPRWVIDPSVNSILDVRELPDAYDPTIPRAYFLAWFRQTRTSGGLISFNLYCPRVTLAVDRSPVRLGLTCSSRDAQPDPRGSVFARMLGDETLYRIPGSSAATLVPLTAGKVPAPEVTGEVGRRGGAEPVELAHAHVVGRDRHVEAPPYGCTGLEGSDRRQARSLSADSPA